MSSSTSSSKLGSMFRSGKDKTPKSLSTQDAMFDGEPPYLFRDSSSSSLPETPETPVNTTVERILGGQGMQSAPDLAELTPETPQRSPVGKSVQFDLASPERSFIVETATTDELFARLDVLQQRLTQAQVDLSGEKAVRKRKEKNLVKLAKELQKRAKEAAIKETQLDKLAETVNAMEARAVQAEKTLLDHKASHKAALKEQESRLADAQKQYRAACRQSEELRRDVLRAHLESDRLRTQLAALEMQAHPEQSEAIIQKTMRASDRSVKGSKSNSRKAVKMAVMVAMVVVCTMAATLWIAPRMPTSANVLCTPVLPGTVLSNDTDMTTMEAPWWAPASMKESAFQAVCGTDRPRTRVILSNKNQWEVHDVNADKKSLLYKSKGATVEIGADSITSTNDKGRVDSVLAPWAL